MRVRDVMSAPVFTVPTDAPFVEIVDQLLGHDVGGVPVVDAGGRVVGVVSEADLISNEAYGYRKRGPLGLLAAFLRDRDPQWVRKAAARTAGELMTRHPLTASPDDSLGFVARQMLEQNHNRVPVIENGELVGIVTRHDLLRQFSRADAELKADIDALLADEWRVPTTHNVQASVSGGVVTLDGTAAWAPDVALFEHVIARLPGVVAVENRLTVREPASR